MINDKLKEFEDSISILMTGNCPKKVYNDLYSEIEGIILYAFMYLKSNDAKEIKNNLLELRLMFLHLEKGDFSLSGGIINEIVNIYNYIESIIKKENKNESL